MSDSEAGLPLQESPYVKPEEWQELFDQERSHINHSNSSENRPLSGFAISGGGIRSASFGLGVMQAFVAKNMFTVFDYLSTVSGGGYIGSSLTWYLQKGAPGVKQADCTPEGFPFGAKKVGAQNKQQATDKVNRNAVLNYIRQHGNYLTPGVGLNALSLAAIAIRGMFISLFIYFLIITGVMMLLFGGMETLFTWSPVRRFLDSSGLSMLNQDSFMLWILGAVGLLTALSYIYHIFRSDGLYKYSQQSDSDQAESQSYIKYIKSQISQGRLWTIMIVIGLLASLPHTLNYLKEAIPAMITSGAGLGYLKYLKSDQSEESPSWYSGLMVYLAVALILYGVLLLCYWVASDNSSLWFLFLIPMALGYFLGSKSNTNIIGHHRMYRDRLMELFMPNSEAIKANQWQPATEANNSYLHSFCQKQPRPYHLINTNVILKDSDNPVYRGRGGDNYILSPLFCGSHATGWRKTKDYRIEKGFDGLSLATAMAASGAALNPNAGVGGEGATRNFLVSQLLNMLNLRLGVHVPLPESGDQSLKDFRKKSSLIQSILNSFTSRFHEKHEVLEISDGGHFENLGLYELIRRKLKLIVVSDGGADPDYIFDDLTNAMEKIRVDFGLDIVFDENALENLIPKEHESGSLDAKCEIADRGFARAAIHYPDGTKGVLIYLKTTMIPDLPVDVLGYKMAHPEFPDESTGDQFFDEKQFEAYRELGYRIGRQFLESEGQLMPDEESDAPSPMVDRIRKYMGK
ncbi:patatin-like phospholipase family protein [bacterium SCSIO 12741]|nr:patatin-like phospholipase family protein [bacterium SCSIO 12741]